MVRYLIRCVGLLIIVLCFNANALAEGSSFEDLLKGVVKDYIEKKTANKHDENGQSTSSKMWVFATGDSYIDILKPVNTSSGNKTNKPTFTAVYTPYVFQQTNSKAYHYTAKLKKNIANKLTIKALGLSWRCQGKQCTISGPWATPGIPACNALAKKVGKVISYGYPGKLLTSTQLTTCNQGVAG